MIFDLSKDTPEMRKLPFLTFCTHEIRTPLSCALESLLDMFNAAEILWFVCWDTWFLAVWICHLGQHWHKNTGCWARLPLLVLKGIYAQISSMALNFLCSKWWSTHVDALEFLECWQMVTEVIIENCNLISLRYFPCTVYVCNECCNDTGRNSCRTRGRNENRGNLYLRLCDDRKLARLTPYLFRTHFFSLPS